MTHIILVELLVATAAAGLVALLVATGFAVYKPRGMTIDGWRKQYAEQSESQDVGSGM